MVKTHFITGIAGFIGFHLARALKQRGEIVIGCDSFSSYYSPELKKERAQILEREGIEVIEADIHNILSLKERFNAVTHLIHLAAQPGVRYSLENPRAYTETNINGFLEILELCRQKPEMKLVFASSSSVYGLNSTPFHESDITDRPCSLYAATKKANELMAHSYHHLYGISAIGLRFFTVYGPFGRPDMAYSLFTNAIDNGEPIKLFNNGNCLRDFTYIDDIVSGITNAIDSDIPYGIYNLGNHKQEPLSNLVSAIEKALNKKALVEHLPMQPGDVKATFADITKAQTDLGYHPTTSLEEGIKQFVDWYQSTKVPS